jgi:hypothetical protein
MINRVQMLQIACTKVNENLKTRHQEPVFDLSIHQKFDEEEY